MRTALLVATLAIALAIELSHGTRTRAAALNRDRGSRFVLALCLAPGIVLLERAPRWVPAASIGHRGLCLALGEAILIAGCVLRLSAMRALGAYFTREVMVSSDQAVVTSGPYRFVRHPSYTALLLYALGAGVVSANWLGLLAITLLMATALWNRIRVEEDALADVLGDAYRSYAARHKRLIPHIW